MKKLTQQEFIYKVNRLHNNKYEYNKVIYVNTYTKIIITCPEHGDFEQTPWAHLQGQGCKKCWINKNKIIKKDTLEEFIEKARATHGDKYEYNKVIYVNSYTKVDITCPEHGEFQQKPILHIRTTGCPKCGNTAIKNKLSFNKNEFIEKARATHGDKYEYNKVIYVNSYTKVDITCPEHGDFEQLPSNHLQGQGCPKCRDKNNSLTLEEFIKKANIIHSNKYKYNKVKYLNCLNKIIITCPEHGDFEQTPQHHLYSKTGCPKCNYSKGEAALESIFKKYNIKSKPQWKFPDEKYRYEYDFYLPELNILIEFHGIQHYKYIPFFHETYHDFEEQILRDSNKLTLAKVKQIPLLKFNYRQLKHMTKEQFEQLVINTINK